METSSLDLLFMERELSAQTPFVGVRVKATFDSDHEDARGEKLLTAPCSSFIELDAEIRRLHAELDELRSRAKKKFYRAQASTAGA
jgi:hypothetical protein